MDGDPSLLVMEIPASIGPGGEAAYAFAIPLMQRRGGFLLGLPLGALDENRLVDEMTSEGEDLLGPSKSFTAELSVEEDGGSTVLIGIQCRFMVVDFSDSALEHIKDYIPEEDDLKVIVPFNEEYPNALPSMLDVPEKILEWARGDNVGRAHFYSAREEPMLAASPKTPAAKKANPKRVTNATMMDQLSALQAQVQALVVAQSAAFQPPATLTGELPDPGPGKPLGVPRMPALSSAIAVPPSLMTPVVKKAAALVGPPPKSMAASPGPGRNRVVMPEDEPKEWKEGAATSGDPLLHAISQQGSALTALVAVKFRPDERPVRSSLIQPQYFYQRRAAKREVAERASGRDQQLLHVAAPAIASKDVPQPCHPEDRGGVPKCQSEFPPVLRAVRGIPQPEGNGADPMVIGVRARLPHPGRRTKSPRASSSNHSLFGTDRNRWRLDHRLLVSLSRRTTNPIVPGEGPEPSHPGPTICTIGSAIPCRGSPCLPEGTRDIEFPEEGNPEPFQSKGIPKHRIPSFTKEAAEVSQETESPSSQFPVKPACAGPVPMELDNGSGLSEFRDCAHHPGCSASNKKISHRGLGTGVDFETEMTHSKWCGMLTSMVLRSRSPFAFYLQKTFRLSRSTTTSATTLFPIPVPFVGLFDRMSPTQAVRDRRTQNIQRVVYIIVYALNYWYFGGPPPDLSLFPIQLNAGSTGGLRTLSGRIQGCPASESLLLEEGSLN